MTQNVSNIKFTDGLSYKQARLTIFVAMILGIIVSIRQVGTDLVDTRREIDEAVKAIITSNISAAGHITQSIDSELAKELAEGMIKHPNITRVFLVDSFDDVIGAAEEPFNPLKQNALVEFLFGKPYQITQTLVNPYAEGSNIGSLGQLVVIVDSHNAGIHFIHNALTSFVATFIQTLILSLILMALFYFRVTQPLKRVTASVASLDPRRPDNKKIPVPSSHHHDEIGQLIQSYNSQLVAIKEHLKKRQDAEKELKYYMAGLEARVEVRTAEANEARQHMQSILDNSPVAIARLDGEGLIQQINPAFIEMFGYSENQLLNNNPSDLFEDPSIYEFIGQTINRVVQYTQSYEVTVNMVRSDGTVFSAASGNRPIDPLDLSAGYIWSLWDMSDRVKMEKALLSAKEQAEAATHAKSDFLANMSHELRTPMNAILGMTWLTLRTSLDDQQRDNLSKVRISAESLLTIVNDILDFSKIEAGKLDIECVPFTLENVLQNLAALISLKAESKGIEIVYEIDLDIPFDLRGDPLRIGQILLNISDNAVKFTERGQVVISSKLIEKTESKTIIEFKITDTGIGMTETQKKRLFDAFTQADTSTTRRFGGTGLGLAICRRLVQLMHGKINAESQVNKGSCFTFDIALEHFGKDTIGSSSSAPKLSGKKAIIFDDNKSSISSIENIFNTWKVNTLSTNSEADFLNLLQGMSSENDPPNMVLLSQKLVKNDLPRLCRTILNCHSEKKPKIILVASSSNAMLEEKDREMGVAALLTKPVTPKNLLDQVLTKSNKSLSKKEKLSKHGSLDLSQFDKLAGINALLVEDNEINQVLAKKLLETVNINVTIVNDGLECVHVTQHSEFDIVLMDIQMPVMDGYTATRTIREKEYLTKLPIIAMSAHAMTGQREKCLEAGMNDYISKPIDPHALYLCLLKWAINKGEPHNDETTNMDASPTQTLEQVPDDWPKQLPGIDVREGYYYAGYNVEVFKKIIERFLSSYQNSISEFMQYTDDKGATERYRWAHTLKGVAGSIGANGLRDASQTLGQACEQADKIPDAGLIKAVGQKLDEALRSLDALLEIISGAVETPIYGEFKLSDQRIQADLKVLHELLEQGDANSGNLLRQIQDQLLSDDQQHLQPLNVLIDEFEFDDAASKLKTLIAQ